MASIQDFNGLIASGNFIDALAMMMENLGELVITTNITNDSLSSNPHQRIQTKISLIDGTINNEVGRDLLTNHTCQELQNIHNGNLGGVYQLLQSQITALQSIVDNDHFRLNNHLNLGDAKPVEKKEDLLINQEESSQEIDEELYLESIAQSSNLEVVSPTEIDYSSIDDWTTISHIPEDTEEEELTPQSIETKEILEAIDATVFDHHKQINPQINSPEWDDWSEEQILEEQILEDLTSVNHQLLTNQIPDWDEHDSWMIEPRNYPSHSDFSPNIVPENHSPQRDHFNPEYVGITSTSMGTNKNTPLHEDFMKNPKYLEELSSIEDMIELEDKRDLK